MSTNEYVTLERLEFVQVLQLCLETTMFCSNMLRSVQLFNEYVNIPKTHVNQSNMSNRIYEPETSLTIQGQLVN